VSGRCWVCQHLMTWSVTRDSSASSWHLMGPAEGEVGDGPGGGEGEGLQGLGLPAPDELVCYPVPRNTYVTALGARSRRVARADTKMWCKNP
jgi:hypothetical protein